MDAHAIITVDLGFGDQGKGSIVDYLVRADEAIGTVIRYNGGPQAAHRVVDGGRSHVFAQFGAGTLVPGVRTHLARGMLIDPLGLFVENDHLRAIGVKDALSRLTIDSDCVIVTPYQIAANRIIEASRENRHGSCGYGVGETRADELVGIALRAGDCTSRLTVARRLRQIQAQNAAKVEGLPPLEQDDWVRWTRSPHAFDALVNSYTNPAFLTLIVRGDAEMRRRLDGGRVVLEGAQGVLLDQRHGFYPHNTWTDTTTRGAVDLLADAGADDYATLGITRAYQTRHGAGPFPTEDEVLTHELRDAENGDGAWQGPFRVGHLDLVLLRYAIKANWGVDALAVTCLDRAREVSDRLRWPWKVAVAYENDPPMRPEEAIWLARTLEHGRVFSIGVIPESADAVVAGEARGEYLRRMKPILRDIAPTASAYAEMLHAETAVPVWITSHGPDASAKRLRPLCAQAA